jgi:hypothetical protein
MATTTDLQARIDQFNQAGEARKTDAAQRYMQLVYDSTDGKELDPSTAAQTLADAGRSAADLELDCQTLQKRRQWARVVAEVPEHDKQAAAMQERISTLSAKRQQHWDKCSRELHDLCLARDAEMNAGIAAGQCRQELLQTAWPHLVQQAESIKQQLASRCGSLGQLQTYIKQKQDLVKGCSQQLAIDDHRKLTGADRELVAGQRAGHERELKDAEARFSEMKEVQSRLLAELAAAESEMLRP